MGTRRASGSAHIPGPCSPEAEARLDQASGRCPSPLWSVSREPAPDSTQGGSAGSSGIRTLLSSAFVLSSEQPRQNAKGDPEDLGVSRATTLSPEPGKERRETGPEAPGARGEARLRCTSPLPPQPPPLKSSGGHMYPKCLWPHFSWELPLALSSCTSFLRQESELFDKLFKCRKDLNFPE